MLLQKIVGWGRGGGGAKCHMGQSFIHFLWGTDLVHNQNMCLLDWVCRLLRKNKLPFSFKAATPCSINKCLSKCCTRHKSGFNLSFGSVAVKIHPFTNSSWVNKDENIKPNKLSQPIGHSRSHSY